MSSINPLDDPIMDPYNPLSPIYNPELVQQTDSDDDDDLNVAAKDKKKDAAAEAANLKSMALPFDQSAQNQAHVSDVVKKLQHKKDFI